MRPHGIGTGLQDRGFDGGFGLLDLALSLRFPGPAFLHNPFDTGRIVRTELVEDGGSHRIGELRQLHALLHERVEQGAHRVDIPRGLLSARAPRVIAPT